eukprot:356704-Chlamydomonas_euryale.AAC.18
MLRQHLDNLASRQSAHLEAAPAVAGAASASRARQGGGALGRNAPIHSLTCDITGLKQDAPQHVHLRTVSSKTDLAPGMPILRFTLHNYSCRVLHSGPATQDGCSPKHHRQLLSHLLERQWQRLVGISKRPLLHAQKLHHLIGWLVVTNHRATADACIRQAGSYNEA